MLYIKKTKDRYEINVFGLKIKLHKRYNKDKMKFDNLLYELKDPRTLENIKIPKVISEEDSLYTTLSSGKSLARYGDGEFKLILGENISFQKYDKKLAERLKNILKNDNDNLLVGIIDIFGCPPSDYMRKVAVNCREEIYKYLDFEKEYLDSMFTRRVKFVSNKQGMDYFSRIKQLWDNKDVVIVEGAGSRLGVGNDLFSNTKSIKRILCPIKDAFSKYDEILKECLKQKDKLFILALGPTATVLADDLSKEGCTALDIGHLDTAYEAFLRGSEKFVHIEGKIVFNEERHNSMIKPCKDENYNKEIIANLV